MGLVRVRSALAAIVAICLLSSCLEPTQVTVEITTDAKCEDLGEVRISVGRLDTLGNSPPSTTTKQCASGGRIGDIVLVPSGGNNQSLAFQVVVGIGQSTSTCLQTEFTGGCIVARRALTFQPHQPLALPVALDIDCIDVPCGATETCREGSCVSALLEDPSRCTEPGGCNLSDVPEAMVVPDEPNEPDEPDVPNDPGEPLPECGNDALEEGESCDDGNVDSEDGCSSTCEVEYLMSANWEAGSISLFRLDDGSYVRELIAPGTPGAPLNPLFLEQAPDGTIYIADAGAEKVYLLDRKGELVDERSLPSVLDIAVDGEFLLSPTNISQKIRRFERSSWLEGIPFADPFEHGFAIERVDSRWAVLTTGPTLNGVELVDGTGLEPNRGLYSGSLVFDVSVTSDRRLLITDRGLSVDTVFEYVSSTTPGSGEPFGLPLLENRSVTQVLAPWTARELSNGNWLISSTGGVFVCNPDRDTVITNETFSDYRGIARVTGP